jgi:hypothetical protein
VQWPLLLIRTPLDPTFLAGGLDHGNIVDLSNDVGLCTDLNQEKTLGGYEWQAQRIVDGRRAGVRKASVATQLVRKYTAEQRSVDQNPLKVVVAVAKSEAV